MFKSKHSAQHSAFSLLNHLMHTQNGLPLVSRSLLTEQGTHMHYRHMVTSLSITVRNKAALQGRAWQSSGQIGNRYSLQKQTLNLDSMFTFMNNKTLSLTDPFHQSLFPPLLLHYTELGVWREVCEIRTNSKAYKQKIGSCPSHCWLPSGHIHPAFLIWNHASKWMEIWETTYRRCRIWCWNFYGKFREKGMRHSRSHKTLVSKSHTYICPKAKPSQTTTLLPSHSSVGPLSIGPNLWSNEAAHFLLLLCSWWENEERLALLPAKAAGSGERECWKSPIGRQLRTGTKRTQKKSRSAVQPFYLSLQTN